MIPHLQIISRAWDLTHVFELLEQGVCAFERETFEGALRLGEATLKHLGFTAWRAKQAAHRFRAHDEETLREVYQHYHEDLDVRIRISADARERLREIMQSDEDHLSNQADSEWQQVSHTVSDKADT